MVLVRLPPWHVTQENIGINSAIDAGLLIVKIFHLHINCPFMGGSSILYIGLVRDVLVDILLSICLISKCVRPRTQLVSYKVFDSMKVDKV